MLLCGASWISMKLFKSSGIRISVCRPRSRLWCAKSIGRHSDLRGKRETRFGLDGFGGPGEIRTHDLFHAMEARSQLRHRPLLNLSDEYNILINTSPAPLPTMVKMPSKGSAAANTVYVCFIALLVAISPSCLVRRRLI